MILKIFGLFKNIINNKNNDKLRIVLSYYLNY